MGTWGEKDMQEVKLNTDLILTYFMIESTRTSGAYRVADDIPRYTPLTLQRLLLFEGFCF